VHAAPSPRQGDRDAPLPRREPRALAVRLARAPRDAVPGDPRLVRPLPRANRLAEPRDGAGVAPLGLDLAVLGSRGRDEVVEQVLREVRDLVHRTVEHGLVGFRRLGHAADLAHVLQRGGVNLFGGRGRIEVVENADVSAHTSMLSALTYSDTGIYSDVCLA